MMDRYGTKSPHFVMLDKYSITVDSADELLVMSAMIISRMALSAEKVVLLTPLITSVTIIGNILKSFPNFNVKINKHTCKYAMYIYIYI